jgi:ABC-2 type transport system ATP-binding protein
MLHTSDNDIARRVLQEFDPEHNGETLSIAYHGMHQAARVNRLLTANDLDVYLLQPKENDLEELFIHLTTSQS